MSETRDDDLEAAIERVGREDVFGAARAAGWYGASPPKWVWWEIVRELEAKRPSPPRKDET